MNKKTWFLIPAATAVFTGCATVNPQRIDSLEKRLAALEDTAKPGALKEKTVPTATSAAAAVEAPETPTKKDIQAALKNAAVYDGDVDGKIGPRTKKAIEAFQEANDLKVDGRVGPNTWEKLKAYYQPPAEESQS